MLDTQQKRLSIMNMTMPWRSAVVVPNGFLDLDDRLSLLGLYSRVKISFDSVSNSGYQAASVSYSWSHTCSGDRRFLIVSVGMLSAVGNSVSGITYNGIALSLIGTQSAGMDVIRTEMWGLVNPTTGSNTIAVTLNSSTVSIAEATSWAGVNQSTPTEGLAGAGATNMGAADATVDVTTSTAEDYVIDAVTSDDAAITAASDQVARANVSGPMASLGMSTHNVPVSPPATITQSYTNVGMGAIWAILALGIIPAGEATGVATRLVNAKARVKTLVGGMLT